MSRSHFPTLAVLAFALLSTAFAANGRHWGHNVSMNTTNANSPECQDHIHIYSDDLPAIAHSEEVISLPNRPLTVNAARNGGIHVRNWDKNEIGVKLCRAAAARTQSEAERALSQVHLNHSGNRVTVDGPETSDDDDTNWSTVVLVFAPKGATLDLSVHNGGISLKQVNANVTGHAVNGGIELNQVSGNVNVEAQNGGISIKDCGGDIKATVQNGGLTIQLGDTWNGVGLDAKTHNGGLVIEVPQNFRSSLEVATSNHSSLTCQSDVCQTGQRTWDDESRFFRIGSNPIIHASTVNGGTIIKARREGRSSDI